ncbi:MAG: GNAT family N-acetyltransferase [Candidatus Thorarchaeota archaeon]
MTFTIRERDTEQDMEAFFAMELESTKENRYLDILKPDEELIEEIREFIDKQPKKAIFIAKNERKEITGFVWASVRKGGEIWDFESQLAWIYDIKVLPPFRRQGLGRKLLVQAEQWAHREKLPAVGLHVFGSNDAAIHLYESMGYTMKNCYFQKQITSTNMIPSPNTAFTIREKVTDQDEENVFALGYENFKTLVLAGKEVPEEEIRDKYHNYIKSIDFKKRKHFIFVAEDEQGIFAGFVWFYISQGDLGDKEYVWMLDLEVAPTYRKQGLGLQLLAHAERLSRELGLDTIRTGVHGHNKAAFRLFRSKGYKEANLFFQKQLIKA